MSDSTGAMMLMAGCALAGLIIGSIWADGGGYARGVADGRCAGLCEAQGHTTGHADPDPDGTCVCIDVGELAEP